MPPGPYARPPAWRALIGRQSPDWLRQLFTHLSARLPSRAVTRAILSSGRLLLALAGFQALLLILTSSGIAGSGVLYGCAFFCGTASYANISRVAAIFGILTFALPSCIGALCRTWQGALALAVLPWWVAVIFHAGTLLTPVPGFGAGQALFAAPFWLDASHMLDLLFSAVMFGLLGWLGWLARRALASERPRRDAAHGDAARGVELGPLEWRHEEARSVPRSPRGAP